MGKFIPNFKNWENLNILGGKTIEDFPNGIWENLKVFEDRWLWRKNGELPLLEQPQKLWKTGILTVEEISHGCAD